MTLKTYMTQNGLQVLYRNIEARLDERETVLKENILQEMPGITIVEVKDQIKDEVKDEIKQEVKGEIKQEVKGEVKDELRDELKDQIKQEVLDELTPGSGGSGGSDDIERVSDDDIDNLFG